MGIVRALKDLFRRGKEGLDSPASGKTAADAGETDVGTAVREIQRKLMVSANENRRPRTGA